MDMPERYTPLEFVEEPDCQYIPLGISASDTKLPERQAVTRIQIRKISDGDKLIWSIDSDEQPPKGSPSKGELSAAG